jgi:6-bladed beta-propeller protein
MPPITVVLLLAAAVQAKAQAPNRSVQPQRLAAATASVAEPFTKVSQVVELAPNRVLVVDEQEKRLALVDLTTGRVDQVGRIGAGPGEYRALGAVLSRPGGGAFVVDFALRRLLVLRADGKFDDHVRLPSSALLEATDAKGNLYGTAFMPRTADGMRDSMFLVRWNPAGERVDTLMKIDARISMSTGPINRPRQVNPPINAWDVLPDGDVIVIEAADYRAVTWRDGKRGASVGVPWEPVRVTDDERKAVTAAMKATPVKQLNNPNGAGAQRFRDVEFQFAASYPPFGGEGLGGRYTTVAPNGDIWVKRLHAVADSVQRYDVLSAEGSLIGAVLMKKGVRVAGIGAGGVYTIERDADDIERVRRSLYPVFRAR